MINERYGETHEAARIRELELETSNLRAQRDGAFKERDQLRLELNQRDALIRSQRAELLEMRKLVDIAGANHPAGAARW